MRRQSRASSRPFVASIAFLATSPAWCGSIAAALSGRQAYVKASNTGVDDGFARALTLSGDTLVVGAAGEDSSATGVGGNQASNGAGASGAAYVFVRSGTTWAQQAYLKASNTGTNDGFGYAVALSGDTLVVGALGEASSATGVGGNQSDNSADAAGAAYVFVRSGSTWTQQAYLKASNTDGFDWFGVSVAISGDTIVVGAVHESSSATTVNGNQIDNSASSAGAAYVFVRTGVTWSQQAYLKASNAEANDTFGASVAIIGDTIAVGAPLESSTATGVNGDPTNNGFPQSGAVYVFARSGTTWTQAAYLKASNTNPGDRFGTSLASSGETLLVGAPNEASNATGVDGDQLANGTFGAGAAYVFARNAGVWSQQAYLKASNTGASDRFGASVSIAGDLALVGAPQEASNATGIDGDPWNDAAISSGAAYAFARNVSTWSHEAYIKATNTDVADTFGSGVAVSALTAVVGAPIESSNAVGVGGDQANDLASSSGAAYVYVLDTPATGFCFGDGTGTPCPCGNHSVVGNGQGCSNSLGIGARLGADGTASLANDTILLSGVGMPNGPVLYFQGTTQAGAGLGTSFGDGIRCAGGTIIRLRTLANMAGASSYPGVGDPSISVKGLVVAPGTRTYQCWYRNAAAFCTVSTFNLSNGVIVTWMA